MLEMGYFMGMKKIILALYLLILMLPCGAFAFPVRPITIYVPFSAGGATEKLASIIADRIEKNINQKVFVKTNSNNNNISATEFINQVKSVPNDGYHLILGNLGTHASSLTVDKETVFYDPIHDFEPIALLGKTPMYLIVRPNFPVKNFKQFLRYLYRNPKKTITIAHAGQGSTSYLAGIYFASILKLDLNFIAYGGSDPALKDIANGYVDMMIDQTTSALSYIQGKLVKSLLITSQRRSVLTPSTPCSSQVGLHEFNINGWNMLFAPQGISKLNQKKLNKIIVDALDNKFVQSDFRLLNTIILDSDKNTPEYLKLFLKQEIDYWQEITGIIKQKDNFY
ncbi:MAG: tripartite-type tricarboxylate transporter receptor subunit TctC [Alphaproteobacteria bacterium]|jgi:tripartite-type tricarboxylate transporter receptor subunit TctC